jgi:hypothetical protein
MYGRRRDKNVNSGDLHKVHVTLKNLERMMTIQNRILERIASALEDGDA